MKYNPYRPNGMVGPGMFAGRTEELEGLDKALYQAKHGNPWHFLIHGERGIGKSSLMLIADHMGRGEVPGFESNEKYNFITIRIEITPHLSFTDLVEKVGRELVAEVHRIEPVKSAATGVWEFVKRWEVAGTKFNAENRPPTIMVEDLCDTLAKLHAKYAESRDGVFVMIDEADKAGPEAHLGEFLKLATERLESRNANHILFGISGISSVIETIRQSHESASRILNHMHLQPLSLEERAEVVEKGLERAAEEGTTVTIKPAAVDWIARFSEGYPHFIQQYASSAFDTDNDNEITEEDVMHGAFKENGALDQLARRFFIPMYSEQINSDEYREVLNAMAASPDKYVSRKHIGEGTGLKKTTLGNALHALKTRGIIVAHPQKQGLYKLPTDSFALWIRMQARREQSHDKKAF